MNFEGLKPSNFVQQNKILDLEVVSYCSNLADLGKKIIGSRILRAM